MSKAFSHNDRPPKAPLDLSHIRLAGEADEMQIFSLFSLMHAEVAQHRLSWPKVAAMIRLATQRTRGIVGVIGETHDIKAAIFATIEPVWYSDEFILLEYFNYVRPDARRSNYATDLLAYGKRCAEELGIDFVCGVYSTIRTEAKCRLYRRVMPKMGEFYRWRPGGEVTARTPLSRAVPANQVAAE
jgi:GNAT superfamily N-acetyltransferase